MPSPVATRLPSVPIAREDFANAVAARSTSTRPSPAAPRMNRGAGWSLAEAIGQPRDSQPPVRDVFIRETAAGTQMRGALPNPAHAAADLARLADHPTAHGLARELEALVGARPFFAALSGRADATGIKVGESRDGTPVFLVRAGFWGRPRFVTASSDSHAWAPLSAKAVAGLDIGWLRANTRWAMVQLAQARRQAGSGYCMASLSPELRALLHNVE